jgi:hypothetical protein
MGAFAFKAVSDPSIPDPVASLIRTSITSVWALELLMCLKARHGAALSVDELVRELRGSAPLVTDLVLSLERSQLVEQVGETYRYSPATPALRAVVEELERLSAERPLAVRKLILAAPHDRVQVFADAFRITRR